MTRFFTKYELTKKDKLLNEDLLLNTQKYKSDLKNAINVDNHRSNVDRAKKTAVNQYMDYDGFHQMVLGADLKGMKLQEFTNIQPMSTLLNTTIPQKKLGEAQDIFLKSFVPEATIAIEKNDTIPSILTKEKVSCSTVEDLPTFKKKWKAFDQSDDKINYLYDTIVTSEQFESMITSNIMEADIFSELIYHIGSYILSNSSEMNQEKIQFLISCIVKLCEHKQFPSLKKFLSKKLKMVYNTIYEKKEEVLHESTVKLFETAYTLINS